MKYFVTQKQISGMTQCVIGASWCVIDVTDMLRKMTHQTPCVMPCVMPCGAYLKENDAMTHDEPLILLMFEKQYQIVARAVSRMKVGGKIPIRASLRHFWPENFVTKEEIYELA